MKASPAPRTLKTSTGKPGPVMPLPRSSAIASGKTRQPIGPRFITSTAPVSARRRRSASGVSAVPPAIRISSSVPTIRSHCGTIRCSSSLTRADST